MPHWTKTATGYRHTNGHTLGRAGKRWHLTTSAGVTHELGRRASFDAAEKLL